MAESHNTNKKPHIVVETTLAEQFADWFSLHGKKVTAILSVAIVAFAGIQLYKWNAQSKLNKENIAFGTAIAKFQSAASENDQTKRKADFSSGINAAEGLIKEYGNTYLGRQMQLQLGNAYYDYSTSGTTAVQAENDKHRIENLEKALSSYEKFADVASDNEEKAAAQIALGNVYESLSFAKNDPALLEKAEAAYKAAVQAEKSEYIGAQAQMELARFYESTDDAQKKAEASKIYEEIAKNRPNDLFVSNPKAKTPEISLPMGGKLDPAKLLEAKNREKWSFKAEAEKALK